MLHCWVAITENLPSAIQLKNNFGIWSGEVGPTPYELDVETMGAAATSKDQHSRPFSENSQWVSKILRTLASGNQKSEMVCWTPPYLLWASLSYKASIGMRFSSHVALEGKTLLQVTEWAATQRSLMVLGGNSKSPPGPKRAAVGTGAHGFSLNSWRLWGE